MTYALMFAAFLWLAASVLAMLGGMILMLAAGETGPAAAVAIVIVSLAIAAAGFVSANFAGNWFTSLTH